MGFEFVFDDREGLLYNAFVEECTARTGSNAFAIKQERLILGDIVIHRDGAAWATVERKRYDDLVSSRFDGRLSEQTTRLREWQSKTGAWMVLMIEGTPDAAGMAFHGAPDPLSRYRLFLKTYMQCVCELSDDVAHRMRCIVLRSRDHLESAALLHTMPRTLSLDVGSPISITHLAPRRSKGDPFVNQLCCTVGVSPQRAHRLREKFASPAALCTAWMQDTLGTRALITQLLGSRKVSERLEYDWTGTTAACSNSRQSHHCQAVSSAMGRNVRGRHAQVSSTIDHPQLPGVCFPDLWSETRPNGDEAAVVVAPDTGAISSIAHSL
jgi:ERCC4-type nuclease